MNASDHGSSRCRRRWSATRSTIRGDVGRAAAGQPQQAPRCADCHQSREDDGEERELRWPAPYSESRAEAGERRHERQRRRRQPRRPGTTVATVRLAHGAARRQPRRSSRRSALEEAPEQHDAEDPEGDGERQRLGGGYVGCHDHEFTSPGSDDVEQYPEERGDDGDESPEVRAAVEIDPEQARHGQRRARCPSVLRHRAAQPYLPGQDGLEPVGPAQHQRRCSWRPRR